MDVKRLAAPLAGVTLAVASSPCRVAGHVAEFDAVVEEILLQDQTAPILEVSWTEKSLRSPPFTEPGDESPVDAHDAMV